MNLFTAELLLTSVLNKVKRRRRRRMIRVELSLFFSKT